MTLRQHRGAALFLFSFLFWLYTGTLAPYASTISSKDLALYIGCDYPLNGDYGHFEAVFGLLTGEPKAAWEWSVVLRRILHPLLGLPFMNLFGFFLGGIFLNFLLSVGCGFLFIKFIGNKFGQKSEVLCLYLLATYTGTFYWSGMPFSYGLIVPFSLLVPIVLDRILETKKLKTFIGLALALGVINLGYDFLPFALPTSILLLIYLKRFSWILPAVFFQILPTLFVMVMVKAIWGVSPVNGNSNIYPTIVNSYLNLDFSDPNWRSSLKGLPQLLFSNFLDSNFVLLPVLYLIVVPLGFFKKWSPKQFPIDYFFLFSCFCVWLFNNAAPAYPGWQMRGTWIARIYQPAFGILIFGIFRSLSFFSVKNSSFFRARNGRLISVLIGFVSLLNFVLLTQPFWRGSHLPVLWRRFYTHTPNFNSYYENLDRLGIRPLGICPAEKKSPKNWSVYLKPENER